MKKLVTTLVALSINFATSAEVPVIVAHRGASSEAPENTIASFELAWKQGADAIEGDFHLTKDGHIVCIHDENTGKVAARNLVIRESSLADLRSLDVGAYRGEEYRGAAIPTIAEVFATVQEQRTVYVEIKSDKAIIPYLLRAIEEAGLDDAQVVVISFDPGVLRVLKARAPQYKTLWLISFKKNVLGRVSPSLDEVLKTLRETGADGLSSGKDYLSRKVVRRVREEGYEFHVWTVDDPETAKRFRDWGALSITTNAPGKLRKYLDMEVNR